MTQDDDADLKARVKQVIVKCARLKRPPFDDQPLFDKTSGAGLDSIDVLELVVGLEKEFGVKVEDWESGKHVLQTVNSIAAFVKEKKGR